MQYSKKKNFNYKRYASEAHVNKKQTFLLGMVFHLNTSPPTRFLVKRNHHRMKIIVNASPLDTAYHRLLTT